MSAAAVKKQQPPDRVQGLGFRVSAFPRPPNYPLLYQKYPLLRAIAALLRGTWRSRSGAGFRIWVLIVTLWSLVVTDRADRGETTGQ